MSVSRPAEILQRNISQTQVSCYIFILNPCYFESPVFFTACLIYSYHAACMHSIICFIFYNDNRIFIIYIIDEYYSIIILLFSDIISNNYPSLCVTNYY